MRAVVYEAFRATPSVTTVPDPVPPAGGVVVQVAATGLCRSDWHGWMGHDPDIKLPHVPGHELAGTVVAAGNAVTRWRAGDRITVPFAAGCGACPECHVGHQQVCERQFQPGFTAWGSFAEYVALDHADGNLVRLPQTMAFETAAALGCRFVTSFRAVTDQGRVRAGDWLAVHGAGGVGLSAIMIAAALGAQVIAIDIADEKLALARSLGATAIVNATHVPDVASAVRDATGGGAHVSIDALGHAVTALNSVLCLRRRGRHVQVGLMLDAHARAPMPMDRVIAYELELLGSHGMPAHRYPALLRMVEAGVLAPHRLVGRHLSLDEAPAALMAMDQFAGVGLSVINQF